METIILVTLVGGLELLAFLIGARTAQKLQKGEEIELPKVNPMEAYREHREHVEALKEQELDKANLENINNYRGDSRGQKDIK
jgi:hypothetical protein